MPKKTARSVPDSLVALEGSVERFSAVFVLHCPLKVDERLAVYS